MGWGWKPRPTFKKLNILYELGFIWRERSANRAKETAITPVPVYLADPDVSVIRKPSDSTYASTDGVSGIRANPFDRRPAPVTRAQHRP